MKLNTSLPPADKLDLAAVEDIDKASALRPTRSDMLAYLKGGRVLPGGHKMLMDVCHPSCHPDGPPCFTQ